VLLANHCDVVLVVWQVIEEHFRQGREHGESVIGRDRHSSSPAPREGRQSQRLEHRLNHVRDGSVRRLAIGAGELDIVIPAIPVR
jgi:transcriptional regulator of nitric oxide reductase